MRGHLRQFLSECLAGAGEPGGDGGLGFAIIALLALLISIANAVTCISITNKLKEKFAFSKNYLTYLTLAGVVIVIWALGLIPYIGAFISFVVNMIGLGIVVYYLFTRNSCDKKETK